MRAPVRARCGRSHAQAVAQTARHEKWINQASPNAASYETWQSPMPPSRKRSALRAAAPCILTIVAFVLPLSLLVCIKLAQFLGVW